MRIYNSAILALAVFSLAAIAFGQEQANAKQIDVLALLEKSGYKYTKVDNGVWEIPATGENIKEFGIRIVTAENLVLALVKLADRKDLILKDALLVKTMELNHNFDSVKLALSDQMLYLRIDTPARLLDERELQYMIEQIANATDETYPHVKQFVKGAK